MQEQSLNSRQRLGKRAYVYTVYCKGNHDRLCSRRIMFNKSAALRQTRCSNPIPDYLAPHGLSWSDINNPQPDMKSEAIDGLAFCVAIFCLFFLWIVLPELLTA